MNKWEMPDKCPICGDSIFKSKDDFACSDRECPLGAGFNEYIRCDELINNWKKTIQSETCENCKYWCNNVNPYNSPDRGDCKSDKFVYEGDGSRMPIDGIGYDDYEGYSASLETGKDFGCIHFEQREGKP